MQKLAQSWLVLEISKNPFLLGLDSFLGEIPIFLFSLVGGVAADRKDRRRLLLYSQLVQMGCAFLLAGLFASGVVRIWHILTLSFFVGLAQAFGGPAYQALIPSLVRTEDVPKAIAFNSIQFNLARIVGPVLGGLALTRLGATWCFGLNGISYLAPIVSLLMIQPRFVPPKATQSIGASLRQGLRFMRNRDGMVALIVLAFLTTLLGIPVIVFLPVFARDVFRGGPDVYTLLLSVSGAGSVAGALVVAAFSHVGRKGQLALGLLLALGGTITAYALSTSLLVSCVFLFCSGAALMAVFAMVTSLVQLITTDEMRGRVMSVYNVAFRGGMPFGSLVAGALIKQTSAPAVLAGSGVLLSTLALYYLLTQRKVASL